VERPVAESALRQGKLENQLIIFQNHGVKYRSNLPVSRSYNKTNAKLSTIILAPFNFFVFDYNNGGL